MSERVMSIPPRALHERLGHNPPPVLLDVRSAPEYRAGHIRGARLLPLDQLSTASVAERIGEPEAGREVPLYLTCRSGPRAHQAAQRLLDAGLRNLAVLEGGTEGWERAGLPMRRCADTPSLERQVQIAAGTLLVLKVAFGFTVHELFFALAALIGVGLITAGVTRWCGMARLLARMPWNRAGGCPDEAAA